MKKFGLFTLAAVLLVGMGLAPACAFAAEWQFYGSARIEYYYNDVDKETIDAYGSSRAAGDGVNDDTDLTLDLQGNSRIGARVNVSDQVYGRFEFGTGVNTRILYGEYTFGFGSLLVGQYYTPISGATSNQVVDGDDNMNSVGAVDGPRRPMLRFKTGGLRIALIRNEGDQHNAATTPTYTATDILIPKIEASWEFKTDAMVIMPFIGFQTYEVETTGVGQSSEDIDSFVVGAHGRFSFGPAYVNVSGHWAQNAGNYGLFERGVVAAGGGTLTQSSPAAGSLAQLVGGDIEDADTYGLALVVGFKASDMVSLEAGVGYVSHEVDVAAGTSWEDDTMLYYVNAPITLAKGVVITPEIGYYDYGELEVTGVADADEGGRLYYGAKFQINF